ncbi:uncharacterized protein LOC123815262 [Phyllostomus hastatus]|uniref:uncharacterized protein LOC123815262 n=1 Tax=Phyllostomus hastatus TaxID=9423 RepID=UPI001E67F887|nr:uncharacterized protein LOC123815262 [Phyllostomus hastatus]
MLFNLVIPEFWEVTSWPFHVAGIQKQRSQNLPLTILPSSGLFCFSWFMGKKSPRKWLGRQRFQAGQERRVAVYAGGWGQSAGDLLGRGGQGAPTPVSPKPRTSPRCSLWLHLLPSHPRCFLRWPWEDLPFCLCSLQPYLPVPPPPTLPSQHPPERLCSPHLETFAPAVPSPGMLFLRSPPARCFSSHLRSSFTGRTSQNTRLSSPTAFAPWLGVAIATGRHGALDAGAQLSRWHLHLSVTKRNLPLPLLKSHCPLVFSPQEWCHPPPRGSGPNLGGALGSWSLAPYGLSIRSPVGLMAKYISNPCSHCHLSPAVTVQEATTPLPGPWHPSPPWSLGFRLCSTPPTTVGGNLLKD